MPLYRTIHILLLGSMLVFFTGCFKSEEGKVQETVKSYNQQLVMALKGMNPNLLKEVATERQRGAVEIFIVEMSDENYIVDSRLETFQVKKIVVNPNEGSETKDGIETAVVNTEEVWTFQYLDLKSKKVIEGTQKVRYKAQYTLEKHGQKWLVSDIGFEEELIED